MLTMAQKRTALPIFNKSKRPRLALVAHPANTDCTLPQVKPGSSRSHTRPPYKSVSSLRSDQYQSRYTSHQDSHQFQSSTHQQAYSSQSHPSVQRTQSYGEPDHQTTAPSSSQFSSFVNSVPTHTKPMPQFKQPIVGSSAPGHAYEPTISHRGMSGPPEVVKETNKAVVSKPSLRLLTATAQGMRHWAKYKNAPILFEIYGVLLSPGVTTDKTSCRQFSLQASDGPVKCLYWEIDGPLPSLVVSRRYRVVGQWNELEGVLHCFSVRGVRVGEVEGVEKAVDVADRAMRKFVNMQHES